MPVHFWRGFDFENRDFYRILKNEDNFNSHFFACYGLFFMFTFEKKRNWLSVIGTFIIMKVAANFPMEKQRKGVHIKK